MPPLTKRIFIWHVIKTFLFYKLFKIVKNNSGFKKYAVLLALIGGTIVYKVLHRIFDKFLCWLLNLKTLRPFDEFFLYDNKNSPSNTTVVLNTEKF